MNTIKLQLIDADPNQPRQHFVKSELVELKNSISENGLLQPLIVEKDYDSNNSGRYLLLDGERRYRCALELNLTEVPVVIYQGPLTFKDRTIKRFNIQEQHKNWNMFDKARAILMLKRESSMSIIEISRKLNIPAPIVHNWLSINEFSERAQGLIIDKKLQFTYLIFLIRVIKYYMTITELSQEEIEDKLINRLYKGEFDTVTSLQKFSKFMLEEGYTEEKLKFLTTHEYTLQQLFENTSIDAQLMNEHIQKKIKELRILLKKCNTLDAVSKPMSMELIEVIQTL